jgi:hypothetical protein
MSSERESEMKRERRAYPVLAGVAPGGFGAGRRPDQQRPHGAPGLVHPLPEEPHGRICPPEKLTTRIRTWGSQGRLEEGRDGGGAHD